MPYIEFKGQMPNSMAATYIWPRWVQRATQNAGRTPAIVRACACPPKQTQTTARARPLKSQR
jgi:hypothetical protein